jgi:hypothetical protein
LGWSYELKNAADYGRPFGHGAGGEHTIDEASRLMEIVDTIMGTLMGE